jgi:hypothetical protein
LRQGTEDMELFPVVAARHGAGTARALLGGFPRLPYHCVLALSAYATKMGRHGCQAAAASMKASRPLVLADLVAGRRAPDC